MVFSCACGHNTKTKKQLSIHQNTCSINLQTDDNTKQFPCNYCNKVLTTKFNCERHMTTCKAKKEVDNDIVLTISEDFFKEVSKDLLLMNSFVNSYKIYNDENRKLLQETELYKSCINFYNNYKLFQSSNSNSFIQARTTTNNNQEHIVSNENINNTINSNNTNNNNTTTNSNNQVNISNANTTNNNQTIVYPFGYENIYFMTDYEMLDILTSKDCLLLALNKIYSNAENKNFTKVNRKIEEMTVIDKACDIQVMTDDAFKRKVITNTIDSLKRMFYNCKDRLKIDHQIILWQNLRLLDASIKEDIEMKNEKDMHKDVRDIMDKIRCMISKDTQHPNARAIFEEVKNSMINEEYKRKFKEKLNEIVAKMREYNEDRKKITLTSDYIKEHIWNRNPDTDPALIMSNPRNHIIHHNVKNS